MYLFMLPVKDQCFTVDIPGCDIDAPFWKHWHIHYRGCEASKLEGMPDGKRRFPLSDKDNILMVFSKYRIARVQ